VTIVVGVSPTTGSPSALRWAAAEAQLRGVPLKAVMAWRTPRPPVSPGVRAPAVGTTGDDYPTGAETRLRDYVQAALGSADGVTCEVVQGTEVNALLSSAQGANLLVIGEPQAGRLSTMMSSLTAPQVVLKADCPVVVMPSSVSIAAGERT
jgi:nucleotide-binding universal stress UspA family protein